MMRKKSALSRKSIESKVIISSLKKDIERYKLMIDQVKQEIDRLGKLSTVKVEIELVEFANRIKKILD